MKCTCKTWKDNIDKLNSGWAISVVHGMKGYSGELFIYCPWCSRELIEDKDKI